MRRTTALIVVAMVGAVAVILAGLLTCAIYRPVPERPNVEINFVGYSNDISHSRLGVLLMTNKGSSAVVRDSHYRIQIPTDARWTTVSKGWLGAGAINAAGSEMVSVPAPTNHEWRILLSARSQDTMLGDILGSVLEAARAAGLRVRPSRTSYGFYSEWIQQ
jgi:hypothetical protein